MECDRGSFSTISAVLLSVGVSQETPKSVGDGCKSRNPWLEHISRKKQKSETGRCSLHPPVSLCPCIKGVPEEIRKKVRKLLYHTRVCKLCLPFLLSKFAQLIIPYLTSFGRSLQINPAKNAMIPGRSTLSGIHFSCIRLRECREAVASRDFLVGWGAKQKDSDRIKIRVLL